MKIAGIILIVIGVIGIVFEKHPTDSEKEIESELEGLKKSKSFRICLIDNREFNIGLIVLGLIFVLID